MEFEVERKITIKLNYEEAEVERKITIKLNYVEALDLRYMLHDYKDCEDNDIDETCRKTYDELISFLDSMD